MKPTMSEASSVIGRHLYGGKELGRLLNPRTIAVVGASTTPGSFGLRTIENIGTRFPGAVYAVNPRYKEVLGRPCFPSIEELPEVPDCAIITVPGDFVVGIVERAAAVGVGGCILYSAGYAEVGTAEGIVAQQRLGEIARTSGMRILGPNCLGIINCSSSAGMTFMPKFSETEMVKGRIGLVSQSGGLGYVVMQAMERGVGFSSFLSAGNCCDVDVADLISYLVDDADTNVIACMLEGVPDGRRFIAAGRRALEAGKPLLVYKMGKSELSKRTALSHTGSIAGSNAAYRATFDSTGMVPIDNWEELLETARLFSMSGRPQARGVGIMANSGGAAVMGADKADEYGIELPQPALETRERLAAVIPSFGSNANPSDLTAESLKSNDMFETCIRAFDDDPSFGAVVVPMMSAHRPATVERAAYICGLAHTLKKPMSIVWVNEWYQGPGSEHYDRCSSIGMFRSMGRCLKAIRLWLDYFDAREELLQVRRERLMKSEANAARRILGAFGRETVLSEGQSKAVLASYGIPVTQQQLVHSSCEAAQAAKSIGYPVVLKAESAEIPHKTEAGVVRLHLTDERSVIDAYDSILAAASQIQHRPRLDGISVQKMISGGTEMLIGARMDAQFGPTVSCGFGGIEVEITRDLTTALAPVSADEADRMLRKLRGHALLTGFRGRPPVDTRAFAEAVSRLSHLIADLGDEIEEIDVNPVLVDDRGLIAVDALIVRRQRTP